MVLRSQPPKEANIAFGSFEILNKETILFLTVLQLPVVSVSYCQPTNLV
jgi:hypothetical protein